MKCVMGITDKLKANRRGVTGKLKANMGKECSKSSLVFSPATVQKHILLTSK